MNYEIFKSRYDITKDQWTSEVLCYGGFSDDFGYHGDSLTRKVVDDCIIDSSFIEFDELLEKIAPNLTVMQYRKIINRCVKIYTSSDTAKYSDHCLYLYIWRTADIRTLYETLVEIGVVIEN